MLWSQYPNLKYKPDPVIYLQLDQLNAFRKHFDAQVFSYKKQVVINLVRLLLFVMFYYSLSSQMCILLLNFQCDQKGQEIGLVNNFNRFIRDMNHKDVRWRTFYVSLIFVFLYSSFLSIFLGTFLLTSTTNVERCDGIVSVCYSTKSMLTKPSLGE